MSDSFLEEQVRRIKQLTERMSQATKRSDVHDGIAREHQTSTGPLHAVRDVRVVNSVPDRKRHAIDAADRRHRRRRRR
jgi:hypothetical protein